MVFVDLEKAYDTVHASSRSIMRRNREKGLPDNYIMIVQDYV